MASKPPLISDELKALATSEHLYAIVILDNNGNVAFQSSPVSLQLSSLAKDLVSGRREAVVHLFGGIGESGADGPADYRYSAGRAETALACCWASASECSGTS